MQVICPSCGEMLRSEDMNLDQMVGKCRRCHALVNLRDFVPQQGSAESAGLANRPRPVVPQPHQLTVEDSGTQLRIFWPWFSGSAVFLIFFCIAWDSFLIFWYYQVLAGPGNNWLMIVFPIAHVAVGVWLTYFTLASLVNRTEIVVDHETLRVRHRPFPWPGSVVLPVEQIAQLYVGARCVRQPSKPDDQSSEQESESESCEAEPDSGYDLNALLHDGTARKLLSLSEPEMAMFIEQAIEKFLGLGDQPVAGELPR
jgi:hypothetical protein